MAFIIVYIAPYSKMMTYLNSNIYSIIVDIILSSV